MAAAVLVRGCLSSPRTRQTHGRTARIFPAHAKKAAWRQPFRPGSARRTKDRQRTTSWRGRQERRLFRPWHRRQAQPLVPLHPWRRLQGQPVQQAQGQGPRLLGARRAWVPLFSGSPRARARESMRTGVTSSCVFPFLRGSKQNGPHGKAASFPGCWLTGRRCTGPYLALRHHAAPSGATRLQAAPRGATGRFKALYAATMTPARSSAIPSTTGL